MESQTTEEKRKHSKRATTALVLSIIALVLAGLAFVSVAFGSFVIMGPGETTESVREVKDFQKINLSGAGVLKITQGTEESITIIGDSRVVPKIRTEVVDGVLNIKPKTQFFLLFFPMTETIYDIKVKDLNSIKISGSGEIETLNELRSNDLVIDINGSGEGVLNIDVVNLNLNISGSGEFTLDGNAEKQDLDISGSGKYFGNNLLGKEGVVKISGSGDVQMNVSEKLDIKISGSGGVEYMGNPEVSQSISGSGDVERLQ